LIGEVGGLLGDFDEELGVEEVEEVYHFCWVGWRVVL
jgi:hypothetical protein